MLAFFELLKLSECDFLCNIQDNIADYQVEPIQLSSKLLQERIKSVFDYRCIISGAEHQFYVISLGVKNY